jgi:hypothetical protein
MNNKVGRSHRVKTAYYCNEVPREEQEQKMFSNLECISNAFFVTFILQWPWCLFLLETDLLLQF